MYMYISDFTDIEFCEYERLNPFTTTKKNKPKEKKRSPKLIQPNV